MTADEVRARIETSWHELAGLVSKMDEAALSAPGPEGWSVKDHLVHIGAWEQWLRALFEHTDRLAAMGAPGVDRKVDDINAVVWERHRHDPAPAALDYFRAAHKQLMAVLSAQATEDFERPYSPFFSDDDADGADQPVLVAVAANTYDHYAEHIDWIKALTDSPAHR